MANSQIAFLLSVILAFTWQFYPAPENLYPIFFLLIAIYFKMDDNE